MFKDKVKGVGKSVIKSTGMEKPLGVAGYLYKLSEDKKIAYRRLRHIPLINNDEGTIETALDQVKFNVSLIWRW